MPEPPAAAIVAPAAAVLPAAAPARGPAAAALPPAPEVFATVAAVPAPELPQGQLPAAPGGRIQGERSTLLLVTVLLAPPAGCAAAEGLHANTSPALQLSWGPAACRRLHTCPPATHPPTHTQTHRPLQRCPPPPSAPSLPASPPPRFPPPPWPPSPELRACPRAASPSRPPPSRRPLARPPRWLGLSPSSLTSPPGAPTPPSPRPKTSRVGGGGVGGGQGLLCRVCCAGTSRLGDSSSSRQRMASSHAPHLPAHGLSTPCPPSAALVAAGNVDAAAQSIAQGRSVGCCSQHRRFARRRFWFGTCPGKAGLPSLISSTCSDPLRLSSSPLAVQPSLLATPTPWPPPPPSPPLLAPSRPSPRCMAQYIRAGWSSTCAGPRSPSLPACQHLRAAAACSPAVSPPVCAPADAHPPCHAAPAPLPPRPVPVL